MKGAALQAFNIDGTEVGAFKVPNWVTDADESNEGLPGVHWWMPIHVNEFSESILLTNNA